MHFLSLGSLMLGVSGKFSLETYPCSPVLLNASSADTLNHLFIFCCYGPAGFGDCTAAWKQRWV
ncbi:MAG: hypothetical protein CL862_02090 [Cyanobium sp. NAT70]|nr:hypothetical protein [Cyanobium sp. NAT70]